MSAIRKRRKATPAAAPAPKMKATPGEGGCVAMTPGDAHPDWHERVAAALGTVDPDVKTHLLTTLTSVLDRQREDVAGAANLVLAILHDVQPRGTLEAMLAVQMIATHAHALRLLGRIQDPLDLATHRSHSAFAARFLRLFTEQLEALQRLRGTAGRQHVTVEHVHVESGGRAIVGAVGGKER